MILWRLYIGRGLLQWYGRLRTYTLWPRWRREDRNNL